MPLAGARGVTDWFPWNSVPLTAFVCWKERVSAELPSLFMANKASLQSPAHATAKLIGVAAVLCSESDRHGRINKSPPFTLNPQPWNCSLTVATLLFLLRIQRHSILSLSLLKRRNSWNIPSCSWFQCSDAINKCIPEVLRQRAYFCCPRLKKFGEVNPWNLCFSSPERSYTQCCWS